MLPAPRSRKPLAAVLLAFLVGLSACKHGGSGVQTTMPPAPPPGIGDGPAFPLAAHVDQASITAGAISFIELFSLGDQIFEAQFNGLDGAGALRLPDGTPLPGRFSRVPPGGGRFTGPNAQSCTGCHNSPFPTSAGEAASNVFQDPARLGDGPFNARNTLSLFGSGAIQRLAEEMTEDLLRLRDEAALAAVAGGPAVSRDLVAKGVSFGSISASRDAAGAVSFDVSGLKGVDPDLVVRGFGWKGSHATLRDFCRGAALNELGMEPDELVARDHLGRDDPDGDGVAGELSVGDVTAIVIYSAAQEVPQPLSLLVRQGLVAPPTPESGRLAARGETLFASIGCADCHRPELRLLDTVFEEPTRRGGGNFLDGLIDPAATALDPDRPFRFNLIHEGDSPRFEPHSDGGARIRLFGDLRRHRMGRQLADAQPTPATRADGTPLVFGGAPVLVPEETFLTAELWGVGNTGPWLHDGRAGSLEEAIRLHGEDAPPPPGDVHRSEAQEARDAFAALWAHDRMAVVEFLKTLLLFSHPEEE